MNLQPSKHFPSARWFYTALIALIFLSSTAARAEEARWLFVFNTSSAMKKRLPEIEAETRTLFRTDFAGSLHEGDSLGVWTFNDNLQMGKFPLVTWEPEQAGEIATNIMNFVRKQSYSGGTSFSALQPTLNSVIDDSERLTVVILCDGEDEIHWTPYDDGLNNTLKQTRDDRTKLRQPYVIILRTQKGKYVGATVNFPPIPANFPAFPLLPREIKPVPPPVVQVQPTVIAPPLIIVGTHVSDNPDDITNFLATNQAPVVPVKPEVTTGQNVQAAPNPAPPVPPAPVITRITNPPPIVQVAPLPAPPPAPAPAPAPVVAVVPVNNAPAVAATNAVAATDTAPEDPDTRILTYVGVGLLGAAIALVIFLVVRGRPAPHGSLITSSMQADMRPPEKK